MPLDKDKGCPLAFWRLLQWAYEPYDGALAVVSNGAPANILNSLSLGRFGFGFKCLIFKCNIIIDILNISSWILYRQIPQVHVVHKSTLVQVMVWCHQATNHYLSQCWPRSMSAIWVHLATIISFLICVKWGNWVNISSGNNFLPAQSWTHRENSHITQTTPEPTLLSWGRWPCEKIPPHPWPHCKPGLIVLIGPLRPYCSQALWSCSGVSWK